MSVPLVSVVMSVLNGEAFLAEAVESILDQTFRDFEFIIIDDGSTDTSASILDSFQRNDPRVQIYHQENRGLIESLNRGCRLARGKYIARMDADDIAIRNRLSLQIDFMKRHPDVGILGGAVEFIDKTGKITATSRNPIEDCEIRSALLRGCPFWHPTVLMRKDVLIAVGGYRKVFVAAEDYDLWLRVANHCQMANLDAVVLKYRLHSNQSTIRKFRQTALSTLAAQVAAASRRNGNPDPFDSVTQVSSATLLELGVSVAAQEAAVAGRYLWSIRTMYETGDYEVALSVLTEMFRTSDWLRADNRVIADLRFLTAQIYWKQRRFLGSILSAVHAVINRPLIIGRPLKPLLSWLRQASNLGLY